MRARMLSIILTSLVGTVLTDAVVPSISAQCPAESDSGKSVRAREVVVEGWKVPGRTEFRKEADRKEVVWNGVKVNVFMLETDRRPIVDRTGKSIGTIDDNGFRINLKVKPDPVRFDVRIVNRLEVSGKIFAYQVTLVPIIEVENVSGFGADLLNFTYIDEDGDGRFEMRYQSFEALTVPQWVLAERTNP